MNERRAINGRQATRAALAGAAVLAMLAWPNAAAAGGGYDVVSQSMIMMRGLPSPKAERRAAERRAAEREIANRAAVPTPRPDGLAETAGLAPGDEAQGGDAQTRMAAVQPEAVQAGAVQPEAVQSKGVQAGAAVSIETKAPQTAPVETKAPAGAKAPAAQTDAAPAADGLGLEERKRMRNRRVQERKDALAEAKRKRHARAKAEAERRDAAAIARPEPEGDPNEILASADE